MCLFFALAFSLTTFTNRQFLLDLPLCPRTEVKLSLPTSASTAEAVQSILAVLGLGETFSQRGVHCALMDVTSRTRGEGTH